MITPVEEVVLLDEEGRAIGTAAKATVHHAATPLHLAFSCYVFDGERLLVTRRALHKPTWPGAWTNTACGHPAPGEPLADAVRRRVRQELGIDLDDLRLVLPAFRYRAVMPDGTVENEMCPVLVAAPASSASSTSSGGAVRPDADEVADAVWEPWPAFRAGVLDGTREVSPWCREQVAALPAEPWTMPAADPVSLPDALR